MLQQFAVAPSDNLFHDLEIVVRSGLTDPLIQKELLIAEKDRYDRRLQSYQNKLLLTIEPKHTLEEITADFFEYIDYLKENYKAKSTYGWLVLAALILRLSRINEGPDKTQALMTLIRGLDDARTSYHNMPSKHVKNKNYSCQKGFEEFLLISHYEILPGHREAASTTEALILAITEPFVQRLGAEDGCRQTFSQLLYHIYLEAAGYEVRNAKKEFYVLAPGKSKQFLKNKYLSRFATPALKKIHEARFDSLYAQLCQQLIEVSVSQISIIDYLLEENALKIECRIDHFLVCNHPEKTENEIFEHMVKRGPFIDKAHLKTVLALIDQQASLKTLQICAQLQTYPAVNIEPLAKHEMQQRYKEYLERQGFQVMHDFLLVSQDENLEPHFALSDAFCHINHQVVDELELFFSEDVFLEWVSYSPRISAELAANLALLCAKSGYSRALNKLIDSYAVNINYSCAADSGKNLIQIAAANGHVQVVRHLFQKGAITNTKQSLYGFSIMRRQAIQLAASKGYREVVQALIELGDDLSHSSCLEAAISAGYVDVVHLLIEAGAPMSDNIVKFVLENAPLGVRPEIMRAIVEAGPDFSSTQELLINSIMEGEIETANLLLSAGVGIEDLTTFVTTEGPTIGMMIVLLKNIFNATPMSEKTSINTLSERGLTPLMHAAIEGDCQTARELIQHGALINKISKKGETALYLAVQNGHPEIVKEFLCHNLTPCYTIEALKLAIRKMEFNIASLLYDHCSSAHLERYPNLKEWEQKYFSLEISDEYRKQLIFSYLSDSKRNECQSEHARCIVS